MDKRPGPTDDAITTLKADLSDPEHAQAILRLHDTYARDPMGNDGSLPSAIKQQLISGLQQHPTTQVFLAQSDREYVGLAVCFTGFSTFYARPLINIHDLAVAPGYRGRGVGRILLKTVEQAGRTMNCCKITLEVRQDNTSAEGLYRSEGYSGAMAEDKVIPYYFLEKRL